MGRKTVVPLLIVAGLPGPVALFGQLQPARPEFAVASLKPAVPFNGPPQLEQVTDSLLWQVFRARVPMVHQRVKIGRMPLTYLIALACRVAPRDVVGPSWMSETRFEIEAKVPDGTRDKEFYAMLLSLLEDRFDLRWHPESKTGRGYELVVDKKGAQLTESQPTDNEAKPRAAPDFRGMQFFPGAMGRQRSSASQLCEWFADILHAPVSDATGLTGKYDFQLTWSPQSLAAEAGEDAGGPSLFAALQEQLGLKVEYRKSPVDCIVIDRVEMPSQN